MDRRDFLQHASVGTLALSFPHLARSAKNSRMGIVVHSYASRWQAKTASKAYPRFDNALDLLEHCHQLGAGGVQVGVEGWTADFTKQVRDQRERLGLYLEGSIGLPKASADEAIFDQQVRQAKEAGAQVLRTVCSAGRRYEVYHSDEAFQSFQKKALLTLQTAEPILRKHGIKLAVENHKDWRSTELVAVMKQLSSEWIGVTLDFGNNIALLEDPMTVAKNLAPYALSTHIKDMAVDEYADGFRLSEVPLGQGVLDLPGMIALCRQHNPNITFSLEMITRDPLTIPCLTNDYWATMATVPGTDLARAIRVTHEHKPQAGLPTVSQRSIDERLAIEEENIRLCLGYGREKLGI